MNPALQGNLWGEVHLVIFQILGRCRWLDSCTIWGKSTARKLSKGPQKMEQLFTAVAVLLGSSLFAAMCGGILFLCGFFRSPYSAFSLTAFLNAVAITLVFLNAGENHNWRQLASMPFLLKAVVALLLFGVWWLFIQKQASKDARGIKQQIEQISRKRDDE